MARIDTKSGALVRVSQWYSRISYGKDVETIDVLGHRRGLLVGYGALEFALERSKSMDGRLKDLAAIRAAMLVGCEFGMDIASHLGREAGLSDEQLQELPRWRESERFSPAERLVLEYAEAMTRTPTEVSDELVARLREHVDERQLVELTATIALENFRARFNDALGVEPSGFSEGAFCVLPDRAAAAA
jgi:AhpD family alkylhydroperoxidase